MANSVHEYQLPEKRPSAKNIHKIIYTIIGSLISHETLLIYNTDPSRFT